MASEQVKEIAVEGLYGDLATIRRKICLLGLSNEDEYEVKGERDKNRMVKARGHALKILDKLMGSLTNERPNLKHTWDQEQKMLPEYREKKTSPGKSEKRKRPICSEDGNTVGPAETE